MLNTSRFNQLDSSIQEGVQFLKSEQLSDGEFMTAASSDPLMETGCSDDSSCFLTSFILYSLRLFDSSPEIEQITGKALAFLRSQMDEGGIFRYWSSKNSRRNSFPPDLDDTACICAALSLYGSETPDNRAVFAENRTKEGLFYTWLAVRDRDNQPVCRELLKDINTGKVLMNILRVGKLFNYEPAVNANVLFYLGENELTRPAVTYLIETIKKNREEQERTYYHHPLSLYYFIARAYAAGATSLEKIKIILAGKIISFREESGHYGSPMVTALALCALSYLDYFSFIKDKQEKIYFDKGIDYLIDNQTPGGGWKKEAFFLGPAPYYGADALTTGFCLEALGLYRKTIRCK